MDSFPEDGANPDKGGEYELLRANAIFGDGASAVLVGYDDDPKHPYLLDFESYFDPFHSQSSQWPFSYLQLPLQLTPLLVPLNGYFIILRRYYACPQHTIYEISHLSV